MRGDRGGGILGVKLFAPLEEAREKLAHFKLVKDEHALTIYLYSLKAEELD